MAEYVSKEFVKNKDFQLCSTTQLSSEESKFQRLGWLFDHWVDKDDSSKTYSEGQTVNLSNDVVNLSAIWREDWVTVTFDDGDSQNLIFTTVSGKKI